MSIDDSSFREVDEKTLHQQAELIDDDKIDELYVVDKSIDIKKLIDKNACLLEGNRGVGKSHILKYVEKECDKRFESQKILAVYITFNEALKIDSISGSYGTYDPFIQWASLKTLRAIFVKAKNLGICTEPGRVKKAIFKVFGNINDEERIYILLNALIKNLETTPIQQKERIYKASLKIIVDNIGSSLGGEIKKGDEVLQNLEHIPIIKEAIKVLIKEAKIKRVIILFDEAAHTLIPEQQGKFFTFFKGLKDNEINVKAAVYPLITNYGDQFDYLHDAKIIRINRSELEYEQYIEFFDSILRKRIGESDKLYIELTRKTEIYHMLMFSSFGNPRLFFDLIDEIDTNRSLKKLEINKIIKTFVDTKIWVYFQNAARTEQFRPYMELGEKTVKEIIIPTILRSKTKGKDFNYFLLKDKTYTSSKQIKILFDYLEYGGIIAYRDKRTVGHKEPGRAYSLNLAIAFSENIIKSDKDIKNLKIYGARMFQINDNFLQLMKEFKEIYLKYTNETSGKIFNPEEQEFIRSRIEKEEEEMKDLFVSLLNRTIDVLRGYLTSFEYKLLAESNLYKVIGDIYEASESEIRQIRFIGLMRANKIKNAVRDYLNG